MIGPMELFGLFFLFGALMAVVLAVSFGVTIWGFFSRAGGSRGGPAGSSSSWSPGHHSTGTVDAFTTHGDVGTMGHHPAPGDGGSSAHFSDSSASSTSSSFDSCSFDVGVGAGGDGGFSVGGCDSGSCGGGGGCD